LGRVRLIIITLSLRHQTAESLMSTIQNIHYLLIRLPNHFVYYSTL